MSQHIKSFYNTRLTAKQVFINRCIEAYERFQTIEEIVNEIERLMEMYNITYITKNNTSLLSSSNGDTKTMNAREWFEHDINMNVNQPAELERVIIHHLNFYNMLQRAA